MSCKEIGLVFKSVKASQLHSYCTEEMQPSPLRPFRRSELITVSQFRGRSVSLVSYGVIGITFASRFICFFTLVLLHNKQKKQIEMRVKARAPIMMQRTRNRVQSDIISSESSIATWVMNSSVCVGAVKLSSSSIMEAFSFQTSSFIIDSSEA